MKHIVRKVFVDYEKEEKYINDMSAKGLALTDYSWCRYVFEDATPGEYIYRMELLENLPSHPESMAYIRFLEETGIEHVASYLRWIYFRKKASEGAFEIYTDIESRIKHYRRIRWLFSVILFTCIFVLVSNSIVWWIHRTNFIIIPLYGAFVVYLTFFVVIPLTRRIRKLKKAKSIHE